MDITRSVVSERDRALLGGDYATYHAQATRRIHAVRRRLGVVTPRGRKFTPKAPVTAEQVGQNVEWVQLLLASAERSWASAMSMKSSQSIENTQKPMAGSTKRQIVSRFRRAIAFAEQLYTIVQNRDVTKASTTDVLEAKAYLSLLKGGQDFEKSKWDQCVQSYSICRVIYAALGATAKTDIYKDLLSSTVDPSIRYAAYQMKMPRTKAVPEIVIDKFPSGEDQIRSEVKEIYPQAFETSTSEAASTDSPKNIPTSISWRNRKVKLEDARISQALGVAKDREQDLSEMFTRFKSESTGARELAAAYDDIINATQEAADATKSAIDELVAEGVEPGEPRMQSLQITRTAVNYAVIEWRIGRNRILCGSEDGMTFEEEKSKRPVKPRKDGQPRTVKEESSGRKLSRLRERVALYEAILQSVDAVKELSGVIADEDFVSELGFKRAYFRALKCLAIGRSHAISGKIANALALYSRASELAQTAIDGRSPTSLDRSRSPENDNNTPPQFELTPSQTQDLFDLLKKLVIQFRGLAELKSLTTSSTQTQTQIQPDLPLISQIHLNQYIPPEQINLNNLVNYPPKLQPVPVKPLFFDLAWNYIDYPGRKKDNDMMSSVSATPVAAAAAKVVEAVLPGKDQSDIDRPGTPASVAAEKKRGWFGFGR